MPILSEEYQQLKNKPRESLTEADINITIEQRIREIDMYVTKPGFNRFIQANLKARTPTLKRLTKEIKKILMI